MTDRIAIVDEHVVDQDPAYDPTRPTWVTGATQTLLMPRDRRSADMIDWVRTRASSSTQVDLDILCHGALGIQLDGTQSFLLCVGSPGLFMINVPEWHQVEGCIRRIRVYACGVESPEHGDAFAATAGSVLQHTLMKRLSRETGANVKYSLQTAEYGMSVRTNGSQSLTADQMLSPVYVAEPSGWSRLER